MNDFSGVKIALLNEGTVVVSLRDDKPGIPFPGMWDLPGGGREGEETPVECAIREVQEELSITLGQESIVWDREYPSMTDPTKQMHFMVANITQEVLNSIVFGDEGQEWKTMKIEEFITHDNVVPKLKDRLKDFIESNQG